jgi:hypothetical protein
MANILESSLWIVLAAGVGAIGCAGKTSDNGTGSQGLHDASAGGGVGSGGATSGSGGNAAGSSGAGGASGGTMFCGVETCGPSTRCCPASGTCYDPLQPSRCTGVGCAVAHCVGPDCPDADPPETNCCPDGLVHCPTTGNCYHAGCENCCPPDVECNQQTDCPEGFSCCYNTRRCFNPFIDSCGGPPPRCGENGSCPGNLVCCQLHGICQDPACTDCCPTDCAPASAPCSGNLACCGGLSCCSGVPVPPGQEYCGQECPISDRNAKHAILPIDPDAILARVVSLPISAWSYNELEPSARHIGPMAQDFHEAFGVGSTDTCIPTVDANGVALAAIQALYGRVERLDQESRVLREQNAVLLREVEGLRGKAR